MNPSSSPRLHPLEPRRTLAEEVAERIREFVLAGGLRPGTRVSDTALSADLGVGRGTVREALTLLLGEGFLERAEKGGLRIASLESIDLPDIFELRLALETWSTQNLARHPTDTAVIELERLLGAIDDAASRGLTDDVARLDLQFHDSLCHLGGGVLIHKVFRREIAKMLALLRANVDIYQPLAGTTDELWPLVKSIQEGNPARAISSIEHHIRVSLETCIAQLTALADAHSHARS